MQFFQTYAENLKKAAELGISDSLIATLSDGSVESAAILQGIVNDNGKSVEDINEKWKGVIGAKDTLAKTMADMQTDFTAKSEAIQAKMDSLVQNMNQEKRGSTKWQENHERLCQRTFLPNPRGGKTGE